MENGILKLLSKKQFSLNNKKVSILGDSISTLEGWNPSGYNVFYKDEICFESDVYNYFDTWWGQVIDYFNCTLLANNSWSGSRVTKLPARAELFPSGCSSERINELSSANEKPDIIFIALGDNDWANGAKLHKCHIPEESFADAYQIMLQKIKKAYPKAQIYCFNLFTTFIPNRPTFVFPKIYQGNNIEDYNMLIAKLASKNKCRLVDIYSRRISISTIDGSHPDKEGMTVLARIITRELMNIS